MALRLKSHSVRARNVLDEADRRLARVKAPADASEVTSTRSRAWLATISDLVLKALSARART
jgi:hypothetical protein